MRGGNIETFRGAPPNTRFKLALVARTLHRPVRFGAGLGVVFGLWNLVYSVLSPLAEDSPRALLTFYGPMFLSWSVAGFAGLGDSRRLRDACRHGAVVAFVTFIVFTILVGLRDNLLLAELAGRKDWQNLVARFRASGFHSFRLYVNVVGLAGAPSKLMVATAIGAAMGILGGVPRWAIGRARSAGVRSTGAA